MATADENGTPHLTVASAVSLAGPDRIAIEEWFCPRTVANVIRNPRTSIVVWDLSRDDGHQMVGEVMDIEQSAMLDGYSPQIGARDDGPQTEHRLVIRVDKMFVFSHAPHNDEVE